MSRNTCPFRVSTHVLFEYADAYAQSAAVLMRIYADICRLYADYIRMHMRPFFDGLKSLIFVEILHMSDQLKKKKEKIIPQRAYNI